MKTLTVEEVAALLHAHPATVRQKFRFGQIPAVKVGRRWTIVEQDLMSWLRGQYRQTVPSMRHTAVKPAHGEVLGDEFSPYSLPLPLDKEGKSGYFVALGLDPA